MNTAVVPQISPAPAPVAYETQVVNMLERVVRDPSIDPGRVKEFMDLHERAMNRLAETAFNEAMAAAQSEIERVAPDKDNTQTRSRYASYAAMDAAIRPIYSRHGFALSFGTIEGAENNCVRIVCDVSKGAHVKRYYLDMPADGKGARGNDVMTRTHATGSAVTYGRRYLLGMIFNVAVGEDDDDGNGAGKRMTARERNERIAAMPEDEREEAAQAAADAYGEREGANLRNAMRTPDDVVVWGDAEIQSKQQFLYEARERIRTATDGQTLADWWNSDQRKRACHDFGLTDREFKPLKDFVLARLKALKEG